MRFRWPAHASALFVSNRTVTTRVEVTSIVERQAIHCGTFTSVKDLNAKIRTLITAWNNRAHPFVWTAGQVLKEAKSKKPSDAGH
jgi:hypothetical protein